MLTSCIVSLSVLSRLISVVLAADSKGQKAHFQVEDKSGDLKISATKDLAKVTAQADSVQVVVKPGTADYPVLKSDKPIVHVTQPGWHSFSFRKSVIFKTKMPEKAKKDEVNKKKWVGKKVAHSKRLHRRLKLGLQRRNRLLAKSSSFASLHTTKKKIPSISILSSDKQEVSGSKKSDVKYSGFHVTGNAGNIKMHVTKDETTLSSESGGVDISLNKNPSSSSSTSNKRKFQGQPQLFREEAGDKMIHIATELNNMPYIGLRKSVVSKLQDVKSKSDWD